MVGGRRTWQDGPPEDWQREFDGYARWLAPYGVNTLGYAVRIATKKEARA
jgi:hypothetical protein